MPHKRLLRASPWLAAVVALIAVTAVANVLTLGGRCLTSECSRREQVQRLRPLLPSIGVEAHDGSLGRLADACGKVMVIDFIYTRCPTVCRTLGAASAQLSGRFRHEIETGRVSVVSISIDPAYDGSTQLRAYRKAMGGEGSPWLLLRPRDESELRGLMQAFGVVAIPDGLGGWEHNAAFHVVGPDCRLARIVDLEDVNGAALAIASYL